MKELTLWCCVGTQLAKDHYDYTTLSRRRSDSIKSFLTGATRDWKWFREKGWTVRKVNVTITPIKPT